ncbi:TPA: transcriptional regulator [candidate division WOR-3 bacterium]|jgi:dTDP-4-amino-4,6-dideoxygalactose transaminase|uniref:Transcriptional regulator n=1 Tax=candidate division WOR-3 bacterium TaxID=2052148 RepID=A0A350HAD7_UNCW3|nr:transcriptional regulator [candidate division WOR-3 bacterium]
MKVKMLDLTREYSLYRDEYIEAVNKIFDAGSFILGSPVEEFEKNLAKKLNSKHAVGVANGTDALLISLIAAGINEGDEVITTPFTFFATGEAIVQSKAKPVFVDIDRRTFNIDADKIESAITKKTKAILPVHLYGNPADMKKISTIAEKYGLIVIEDCAQSVGAEFEGKKTGTFGKAGTISFFPTKNLGTAGDGGAIITDDDEINRIARSLRIHGAVKKYIHASIGFNSRLDSIHAALLDIKLKRLEEKNGRRISLAANYNKNLTDKVGKPISQPGGVHIYHQYTITANDRDSLIKHLSDNMIETVVYYPLPLHKQEALKPFIDEARLPVSEEIALKVLSLPIYPELKEEEQNFVIKTINSFYD